MNRETAGNDGKYVTTIASFAREDLAGAVRNGSAELTVIGKLRSGQFSYGRDTVKIIGKDRKR